MLRRPSNRLRIVGALRNLAALVALVLVGAQLTSIGHHVLVAHYLCAEHGSLHHGDAPQTRERERLSGETAVPASTEGHGVHDDCVFPARTPAEAVELGARTDVVPRAREAVDVVAIAPRAAEPGIPLLALAPKLSPPRV